MGLWDQEQKLPVVSGRYRFEADEEGPTIGVVSGLMKYGDPKSVPVCDVADTSVTMRLVVGHTWIWRPAYAGLIVGLTD